MPLRINFTKDNMTAERTMRLMTIQRKTAGGMYSMCWTLEVNEVAEAIRSDWITTGPRTKEFENLIAMCCQTEKAVCLNSATACMELVYLDCLKGRDVEFRMR